MESIGNYFLVNLSIIGAPKLSDELGVVMHQLIHNIDKIKMLRFAEPI